MIDVAPSLLAAERRHYTMSSAIMRFLDVLAVGVVHASRAHPI